jgi:EmrB/QacA subfamily drug resistance transporter
MASTKESGMSSNAVAAPAQGAPPSPSTGSAQLSHRQILEILGGLMLGMFLAALDQTIVTSAIRTIGDDLHGLSVQAWVTTAYLITATISTPLYGKLSDIYGRKRFFLAAITIFVIGSAACSFATSMYMLAGFRAFQGLGAGGLFSLALAIIGDIVPPRERARYQGYFLAVFGTSSVLGPVIGGFFAGAHSILGITGWRWVFLVNVPIGVVALAVVAKVLQIGHTRRNHRIDWWGALTICICLVPLLTVAEQGRTWGWGSGRAVLCYAIGGAGLVLFILAEGLMKEDALIPLRLFRNRTFSLTAIAGFIVGMGMFGGLALLPLYLQIVRGATPTQSGLQLLPLTGGLMVGSVISGQLISRTGRYKIFPIVGSFLMAGGLVLMYWIRVDTPFWRTAIFMAVFGLGLGFIMQPITLAVQNAMAPSEIGVATSSATFFRQMGATAGTAIFLSILFSSVGDKISHAFQTGGAGLQQALKDPSITSNPANKPILDALHGGVNSSALNDTSFLSKVTPVLARPFKVGFSDSMDMIFLLAAGVVVIAFLLFLFLPQIPLRTQSAAAARETPPAPPSDAPSPAASPSVAAGASPSAAASVSAAAEPPPAADAEILRPAIPVSPAPEHRPRTLADMGAPEHHVPAALSNEAVVSGRVEGADHKPVAGATLTVTDFSGRQLARSVTTTDGTYRMRLPTGGSFLLICAAENHQPAASMITVAAGEVRRDVSLSGAGQLEGRVADQAGRPIPGAAITLTDARGEVVATAVSGEDGLYSLPDLYPAEYTLTATAAGTRPAARTVALGAGNDNRIDVVLVTNGTLGGVIRSATSGQPVPDASVLAVDGYGTVVGATVTGADGRYEFEDLQPGAYTVTASGYAPVASRVQLAGDRTDHDILLGTPTSPNGSVAGALSASSSPVAPVDGTGRGVEAGAGAGPVDGAGAGAWALAGPVDGAGTGSGAVDGAGTDPADRAEAGNGGSANSGPDSNGHGAPTAFPVPADSGGER